MGIGINVSKYGCKYVQPYEPLNASRGDLWFRTTDSKLFVKRKSSGGDDFPDRWNQLMYGTLKPNDITGTITTPESRLYSTVLFAGGINASAVYLKTITSVDISNTNNAISSFGDLLVERAYVTSCSNGKNHTGLIIGGKNTSTSLNTIELVKINNSSVDAVSYSALTAAKSGMASCSNGTNNKAIIAGGLNSAGTSTVTLIEVINNISGCEMSTTTFGNLNQARHYCAATSNGSLNNGLIAGGTVIGGSVALQTMENWNISTIATNTNYPNLSAARYGLAAVSNDTSDRAIFMGGSTAGGASLTTIDYLTPISGVGSTTASDFGDITNNSYTGASMCGASNGIGNRSIFSGYINQDTGAVVYISNMISAANATSFGSLSANLHNSGVAGTEHTNNRNACTALSNSAQ